MTEVMLTSFLGRRYDFRSFSTSGFFVHWTVNLETISTIDDLRGRNVLIVD